MWSAVVARVVYVGVGVCLLGMAVPASAQTVTLNFTSGTEVDPGRKYSESGYDVAHPDHHLHLTGGRLQLHGPAGPDDSSKTHFLRSLDNLGRFSFRGLAYFASAPFQFRLRAIGHDESVLDEQTISGASNGTFLFGDIPSPLQSKWECVTRVEAHLDTGTVELDDVTFEDCDERGSPSPVPEPASLALFLPALAGVVVLRRRHLGG